MSKWEQPIDRANEEIEMWKARAEAADQALQFVSVTLGGTDEWTDQETMIHSVKMTAEEMKARVDAAEKHVVDWAVERWNAEVKNRPLVNIHRRTLDDTWRQVMRKYGGEPDALVGPSHDELLEAKP